MDHLMGPTGAGLDKAIKMDRVSRRAAPVFYYTQRQVIPQ